MATDSIKSFFQICEALAILAGLGAFLVVFAIALFQARRDAVRTSNDAIERGRL